MKSGAGVVEAFLFVSVAFGFALALLSWALERDPYKSIGGDQFVKDSDPVVNGSPFERDEELTQLRDALEALRSQRSRPRDTAHAAAASDQASASGGGDSVCPAPPAPAAAMTDSNGTLPAVASGTAWRLPGRRIKRTGAGRACSSFRC